jgi:hypothetical protein
VIGVTEGYIACVGVLNLNGVNSKLGTCVGVGVKVIARVGASLCDYNSETTPANNLVCRAEEKQDVSEHEW